MSKLEVNAVEPQCGTNLTLGASGDTIIIPSGATISNQGTAAGFGPTGAVSWNTTKITADPNPAVTGVGYFADTTSAAFTITLPSSPSAGAVVGIADYANTFATNNITVARNGSNIGGAAENATLFTNGVSVTFVYVDATQGWIVTDSGNRSDLLTPEYIVASGGTVTCCGDYKIHTFTGPGTFTVCSVGNSIGSNTVDYLVVAGGAAGGVGGGGRQGAGGGAGGYRESSGAASGCYTTSPLGACVSALPVSASPYPITVGAGGASVTGANTGNNGNNAAFSSITSAGGGGGGGGTPREGNGGGSGGGASRDSSAGEQGSGNLPPVSPPQGNPGSTIPAPLSGGTHGAGGGGGATGAGGAVDADGPGCGSSGAGKGGVGANSSITGSPVVRAGGGGGTGWHAAGGAGGGSPSNPSGPNGVQAPAAFASAGGGGGTPVGGTGNGAAGAANTGSGGGGAYGCSGYCSGAGGSGIVIIRYKFQ
jgi:hypothetical protein